jgi:hypothetical protein
MLSLNFVYKGGVLISKGLRFLFSFLQIECSFLLLKNKVSQLCANCDYINFNNN